MTANPVKHLLVYADGHTREHDGLYGKTLFEHERREDGIYRREFDITWAHGAEGEPYSMVGLETTCKRLYTNEELRRLDAQHRDELLSHVLQAVWMR